MAKGEERHGAWSIGCFVTLETTLESDPLVQGQVFCYDDRTKVLVLLEGNKNSFSLGEKEGYDLRMLSVNFVKRVVTAEHLQDNSKKQMNKPLPYVCTKRTEQREAKALQEAKKRADQIGVGVTREAQRIFDSVNKTLPCEWKGKDIVVIGEVTIVAPYGVENCSVVAGAEKTLQQVVKVLSS